MSFSAAAAAAAATSDSSSIKKRKRNHDDDDDLDDDQLFKAPTTTKQQKDSLLSLKDIPCSVLQHSIFPCLPTNDLTTFAGLSRAAKTLVEDYRGPHPYIFKQEVHPVKMSYINFRRNNSYLHPTGATPFDVHSAQTVRFLLQTKRDGIVQLEVCLTEYLWTELDGTARYRGLMERERCIWVEIKIFRKIGGKLERMYESTPPPRHPNTGVTCASYYLEGYDENPSDTSLYFFRRREFDRRQVTLANNTHVVPKAVAETQQACTDYIWVCANRLAKHHVKYNFPNLHYILRTALPPDMYKYLPDSFQPEASKAVGPKEFNKCWKPRFPKDPAIWRNFLFHDRTRRHDEYGQLKKDYMIYDIPWYAKRYPKPVVLNPKNLLKSLPSHLLAQNICTDFLGLNEQGRLLMEEAIRLPAYHLSLSTDAKSNNKKQQNSKNEKSGHANDD